jgi:hypothetical protein
MLSLHVLDSQPACPGWPQCFSARWRWHREEVAPSQHPAATSWRPSAPSIAVGGSQWLLVGAPSPSHVDGLLLAAGWAMNWSTRHECRRISRPCHAPGAFISIMSKNVCAGVTRPPLMSKHRVKSMPPGATPRRSRRLAGFAAEQPVDDQIWQV